MSSFADRFYRCDSISGQELCLRVSLQSVFKPAYNNLIKEGEIPATVKIVDLTNFWFEEALNAVKSVGAKWFQDNFLTVDSDTYLGQTGFVKSIAQDVFKDMMVPVTAHDDRDVPSLPVEGAPEGNPNMASGRDVKPATFANVLLVETVVPAGGAGETATTDSGIEYILNTIHETYQGLSWEDGRRPMVIRLISHAFGKLVGETFGRLEDVLSWVSTLANSACETHFMKLVSLNERLRFVQATETDCKYNICYNLAVSQAVVSELENLVGEFLRPFFYEGTGSSSAYDPKNESHVAIAQEQMTLFVNCWLIHPLIKSFAQRLKMNFVENEEFYPMSYSIRVKGVDAVRVINAKGLKVQVKGLPKKR